MSAPHFTMSIGQKIREQISRSEKVNVIGGLSRAALANLVYGSQTGLNKQLIVCADESEAYEIVDELKFLNPAEEITFLPGYDVSPYSGLYPKPTLSAQRIGWLAHAKDSSRGGILLATMKSLLQLSLPADIFSSHNYRLKVGDEIDEDLFEILQLAGYQAVETVEHPGDFAQKGGILDIFSTTQKQPIRVELFGDEIESLRSFDPETQLSTGAVSEFQIGPANEILYSEIEVETLLQRFQESVADRDLENSDYESVLRALSQKQHFPGLEFLLPHFYTELGTALDYLPKECQIWWFDKIECQRNHDIYLEQMKEEFRDTSLFPQIHGLFSDFESVSFPQKQVVLQKISFSDQIDDDITWSVSKIHELENLQKQSDAVQKVCQLLKTWIDNGFRLIIGCRNNNQLQRVEFLLEKAELAAKKYDGSEAGDSEVRWTELDDPIILCQRPLSESSRLNEDKLMFLRAEDLLGRKIGKRAVSSQDRFQKEAEKLSFSDLKTGDHVVHAEHGIGVYEGLKVMSINGFDAEFLQVKYKDSDKLYLPVYKLNLLRKYSGADTQHALDKLGGTSFEKTKIKVKAKLRDIAADLLNLYAKRSQLKRDPYPAQSEDYINFENAFPFDETDDQVKAIQDISEDLSGASPMDRLVCGDVGFGKTEVAMRAAFRVAHSGKQVAVLAPTTVLTFQHFETFQKRFSAWPLKIRSLNRFVPKAEQRQIIKELSLGQIDIVIGTHRLLSQDVQFKNLGLLILDEEQKFGVAHKEKIRKFKTEVDTLAMSATPIPRTLNLSFVGVRDMSLITTPPVDRIPTRTFVCRFEAETIRKAILSEVQRGGQIYFIHNRVQSIYGLQDELRQIVPEVRMRVGHGQMKEDELEKTMTAFFKHEFDLLLCTTIVESGMDVTRANTMFIDQAQNYGLSQLYQLRGRVGRSKQRAYCYLLVPDQKKLDKQAQERLRVIQENTALGSGIRVAHYDLELRGAGDMLGFEQAGHINAVGYELYMELLEQTIRELKGEPEKLQSLEPDIDLKIPALIPDKYIKDIRTRLYYYKALNDIDSADDVDKYEDELRDQFGKLPEPVMNLLGVMAIKSQCRKLGVIELKAGPKFVSLKLIERTPLPADRMIELATNENKKYSITPDSRLKVRINEISWPRVFEELEYLLQQC